MESIYTIQCEISFDLANQKLCKENKTNGKKILKSIWGKTWIDLSGAFHSLSAIKIDRTVCVYVRENNISQVIRRCASYNCFRNLLTENFITKCVATFHKTIICTVFIDIDLKSDFWLFALPENMLESLSATITLIGIYSAKSMWCNVNNVQYLCVDVREVFNFGLISGFTLRLNYTHQI